MQLLFRRFAHFFPIKNNFFGRKPLRCPKTKGAPRGERLVHEKNHLIVNESTVRLANMSVLAEEK